MVASRSPSPRRATWRWTRGAVTRCTLHCAATEDRVDYNGRLFDQASYTAASRSGLVSRDGRLHGDGSDPGSLPCTRHCRIYVRLIVRLCRSSLISRYTARRAVRGRRQGEAKPETIDRLTDVWTVHALLCIVGVSAAVEMRQVAASIGGHFVTGV